MSEQVRHEIGVAFEDAGKRLTQRFLLLDILGRNIVAPYWMNNDPSSVDTYLYKSVSKGGKLTPEEIESQTILKAEEASLSLRALSYDQLRSFMQSNAIGIDCSGFAYQITEAMYSAAGGIDFQSKVKGRNEGDFGIRRTGASDLTSPKNSLTVNSTKDIMAGDLIRCMSGTHVIVVLSKTDSEVFCAHASGTFDGVCTFKIEITDSSKGIFNQNWSLFIDGRRNYLGTALKRMGEGDGVWRLQVMSDIRGEHSNSSK